MIVALFKGKVAASTMISSIVTESNVKAEGELEAILTFQDEGEIEMNVPYYFIELYSFINAHSNFVDAYCFLENENPAGLAIKHLEVLIQKD